jgi:hypothetical protein
MLKLRAIYFDEGVSASEQDLRSSFDDASLAGSRRSKQEQICDRTAGRVHSRQERLIDLNELMYSLVLANDPAAQVLFELFDRGTPALRIEENAMRHHMQLWILRRIPNPPLSLRRQTQAYRQTCAPIPVSGHFLQPKALPP